MLDILTKLIPDFITNLFLSKITILLINALGLYLAFLVFRNNPKNRLNIIYLIMTVLMLLWIDFACMPRILSSSSFQGGLSYLKIAWFATPLFFSFLYLLAIYIVEAQDRYKLLSVIIMALGIFTSLVAGFTDFVFSGIKMVDSVVVIIYGPWMVPFLSVITFMMLATFLPVIKRDVLKDRKYKYFLIGLLVFYISNIIFNIILPIFFGIARYYFIGDYSTLALLALTFYSVIKYDLFEIKIVASELFTIAIWVILAAGIFTADNIQEQGREIAILILIIFLGILFNRSVKGEIRQKKKNKNLTQQLTQANEEISKLKKIEVKLFDFQDYFGKIEQEIKAQLKPASIKFLLYDSRFQEFQEKYPEENKLKISSHDHLITYIRSEKTFIITDELESLMNKEKDLTKKGLLASVKEGMSKINASIIIPLYSPEDNELIALGMLGAKKSKKAYTKEEIQSLSQLAKEASHVAAHALTGYQTSERLKEFQRGL